MRPQEFSILDIPCNVGLDQSYNEQLAPPGTFQTVDNLRIDSKGILQKRIGVDAVGATCSTPSFTRIVGDNVEAYANSAAFLGRSGNLDILGISNGSVFARDEESGVFEFAGRFSTTLPVRKRGIMLGSPGTSASVGWGQDAPPSCAVNSDGYLMTCIHSDQDDTVYLIVESPEGARIWQNEEVTSAIFGKVIAVGATFYFISHNSTTISARPYTVSGGKVVLGVGASVATLASSSSCWDVTSVSADWYLVHQDGAAQCTVTMFTGTSNIASKTFAVTGTVPVSIWAESSGTQTVWVGYYDDPTVSGGVKFRAYDLDLDALTGSATITSSADVLGPPLFGPYHGNLRGYGNTTKAFFVVRYREITGEYVFGVRSGVATKTGTVVDSVLSYGAMPISKPDSRGRVWCLADNGSSNSEFCRNVLLQFHEADLTQVYDNVPPTIVLSDQIFPRFGEYGPSDINSTYRMMYFSSVAEDGSGENRHYFAGVVPKFKAVSLAVNVGSVEVYEYKPLENVPHIETRQLMGYALSAGQLTQLISQSAAEYRSGTGPAYGRYLTGCSEIGWLMPPVITSTSTSGSSGVSAGTYDYVAVYEWVDQYGLRHLSKPSEPVSVTIASAKNVTIVVTAPDITQRHSPLRMISCIIRIYRSLNASIEHHLTTSNSVAIGTTTASIVDAYDDDTIRENEILYTDGGVLGNDLAPACTFMAKTEDRVWVGGGWDRRIIECSKVLVPVEPVQFTGDPSHQVVLTDDCTGLGFMDGQLVAFAENAIFAISGDGPSNQGQGGFAPPRIVASAIGCSNYRSIVETAIGIFFQSTGGIYLLPRGFGQPIYIGEKVKDLFRAQPFVLSAAYRNDTNFHLVRFLIASTETGTTNDVLTYDLTNGQWFRDLYETSGGAYVLSEIGNWKDGFAYMRGVQLAAASTSTIFQDSTSNYYDDGNTYMISQIKTNWVRPFGPNGWGLVKRVMFGSSMREGANISFQVQTDDNSVQSATWDMSSTDAGYRELIPVIQKCTKIQITFADQAGYSSGKRGLDPISFSLEIESNGKLRELPAEMRA